MDRINKRRIKWLILIFAFAVLMTAMVVIYINIGSSEPSSSEQGQVDLSGWRSKGSGVLALNGQWEFYWGRLLTASDIEKGGARPDMAVTVPSYWNLYSIGGKKLPGFGCATYVLEVTGAKKGDALALWLTTCSTAYRMYIDNTLVAQSGNATETGAGFVPQYSPKVIGFTPGSDHFDIIVQVSNFAYARGGLWNTPYLGTPQQISALEKGIGYRDLFLLGSFFITAFLFAAFFIMRREDKTSIYFTLICILAGCRILINGDFSVNSLLPFIGFQQIVRMDYISLFWIPSAFILLFREFYPRIISKKVLTGAVLYSAAMSIVILFTAVSVFTNLNVVVQITLAIASIYIIVCLIVAFLRSQQYAGLMLVGIFLIVIFGGYDIMYQENLIAGGVFELSPVGILILLLINSFVLAGRFTSVIREKNDALLELKISEERERKAELKFLKAQIRPHFIHNALNTIIAISRRDADRSRALLLELSNYLRSCFDFHDLEDVVPIDNELQLVRSYVVLEQARFGEKLRVEFEIDETGMMIPPLILQPLVENAIIHGIRPKPSGGTVWITVRKADGWVRIGVRDDGVGMGAQEAESLLTVKSAGRGIGLNNINMRLNKIYGLSLQIKTGKDCGTEVYMKLPMEGDFSHVKGHLG
ncbi:MAG: histidine kinase [Clostridia bacterium]|nr:histidine kinase [Clostridia bacterium]